MYVGPGALALPSALYRSGVGLGSFLFTVVLLISYYNQASSKKFRLCGISRAVRANVCGAGNKWGFNDVGRVGGRAGVLFLDVVSNALIPFFPCHPEEPFAVPALSAAPQRAIIQRSCGTRARQTGHVPCRGLSPNSQLAH